MTSFKKGKKDAITAPTVPSVPDVPEVQDVPEVPDIPDVPDADELKEMADDAAGDMKWKLMMIAIKSKLSCCYGGTEDAKDGFLK